MIIISKSEATRECSVDGIEYFLLSDSKRLLRHRYISTTSEHFLDISTEVSIVEMVVSVLYTSRPSTTRDRDTTSHTTYIPVPPPSMPTDRNISWFRLSNVCENVVRKGTCCEHSTHILYYTANIWLPFPIFHSLWAPRAQASDRAPVVRTLITRFCASND
ncbi:unnamed protein product [Oppiella nova]|uniref:Uncharacterized protein n=1 Tax=Oppiella nova TaxID=334625 RepID=A0A7R9LE58_9ACAR|nr:unnamed protein product [Oppiella nova]CAG2162611.1 unnamed protein product [Oppiella nova]